MHKFKRLYGLMRVLLDTDYDYDYFIVFFLVLNMSMIPPRPSHQH